MTWRRHLCVEYQQKIKVINRADWKEVSEGLFTKVWEETTETPGALEDSRTKTEAESGKEVAVARTWEQTGL